VTSSALEKNIFTDFENKRPFFEGMEEHYNSKVVPVLTELDKERIKTLPSSSNQSPALLLSQ